MVPVTPMTIKGFADSARAVEFRKFLQSAGEYVPRTKDILMERVHLQFIDLATTDKCTVLVGPELAQKVAGAPVDGPVFFGHMMLGAYEELALFWGVLMETALGYLSPAKLNVLLARKLDWDVVDRDSFADMYNLRLNAQSVVHSFEFVLNIDDADVGSRFQKFSGEEIFFHFHVVDGVFKNAFVGYLSDR